MFAELYGLETVSLRYFNVFGPRQRPDSAYAAVLPLFIDALRNGQPQMVHGDGRQSRAFVYIEDAVAANLAAATAPAAAAQGQAYNIGGIRSVNLMDLLEILGRILDVQPQPVHTTPRPGDVRHSSADVSTAKTDLGWMPRVDLEDGLRRTAEWMAASTSSR